MPDVIRCTRNPGCRFPDGHKGGIMIKKITKEKNTLTRKEEKFCEFMASGYTPREAAAAAKFPFPKTRAVSLLSREEIRVRTRELKSARAAEMRAEDGLARIAFGSPTDAVKLALGDENAKENIEELDLLNVSEIKIAKGGATEIKFFDRIKALSELAKIEALESNGGTEFLKAFLNGADGKTADDD